MELGCMFWSLVLEHTSSSVDAMILDLGITTTFSFFSSNPSLSLSSAWAMSGQWLPSHKAIHFGFASLQSQFQGIFCFVKRYREKCRQTIDHRGVFSR
jgi:hypothetical protein